MEIHHICELVLLLMLAGGCWIYFRQKRSLETENLRLQRERKLVVDFMHELAMALEENPSRQSLMQRIVSAAIDSTGAMSACLYERKETQFLRPAAIEGLFPPQTPIADEVADKLRTRSRFIEQVLRSETIRIGQGLIGEIAERTQGELVRDASKDPRVIRHSDPALAINSLLVVPLRFNQRCFGVLALANPSHGGPFSETDFELVQWLAEQASLALHNADFLNLHIEKQQLDLDLSLASSIQKMLLPTHSPDLPGLDIDLSYLPAQRVGGDLYDLIELPHGRLGVAIADVSGKGIPASLLMTACRSSLRQIAPAHESPASVLSELNKAMMGDVQQGMFVTVFYAVLDPLSDQITYARAGHELPLLVHAPDTGRQTGLRTEFLEGDGLPIGMVGDDLFSNYVEDRRCTFRNDDVLVLYTDGITEAPNEADREFSGSRLADVVMANRHHSANAINASIHAAVAEFAGARAQRDDYTLVTVKRLVR